jgi:hypothetical protein
VESGPDETWRPSAISDELSDVLKVSVELNASFEFMVSKQLIM